MAAKKGRAIRGEDLLRKDADAVFRKLQEITRKNIVNIEKLKSASIALNNLRLKGVKNETQIARAKRKVYKLNQELISSSRIQNELDKEHLVLQRKITQQKLKQKKSSGIGGILNKSLSKIGVAGLAAGAGFKIAQKILNLPKNLENEVLKLDSFRFALDKITGSGYETEKSLDFLIKTSKKYGVELKEITERYVNFFTASTQSGLSIKETKQIFESTSKSAGVLGLKTDEVRGVFLALEQMLSKGKVTTEELRRQLGERLPGAFGIMAKTVDKLEVNKLLDSYNKDVPEGLKLTEKEFRKLNPQIGVSVSKLDEMLKKGQVISHEVLPEFTKQYEKALGIESVEKINTLAAAKARYSSSWTELVKTIEDGGGIISNTFEEIYNTGSSFFEYFSEQSKIFSLDARFVSQAQKWKIAFFSGDEAKQKVIDYTDAQKARNSALKEYYRLLKLGQKGFVNKNPKFPLGIKQAPENYSTEEIEAQIELMRSAKGKQDEFNKIAKGTIAYYKELIKQNEEEIETTLTSSSADLKKAASIRAKNAEYQKLIDLISGKGTGQFVIEDDGFILLSDEELDEESKRYFEKLKKKINKAIDEIKEVTSEEDVMSLEEQFSSEKIDALKITFKESIKDMKDDLPLLNAFGFSERWVEEYREKYGEDLTNFEEYIKRKEDYIKELINLFSDLMSNLGSFTNALFDRNIENIEYLIRKQDEYYNKKYELAEGDSQHQKDIRRKQEEERKKLEAKKLKEKQRQAKWEKGLAITQALIQTALSIVKASPNPVLMALAAASGALAVGTIIAQPIPKYKHGRKGGKAEWAIVGDGYVNEVVSNKDGSRPRLTPNKPSLMFLNKDEMVHSNKAKYNEFLSSKNVDNNNIENGYSISEDLSKVKIQPNINLNVTFGDEYYKHINTQF